MSKKHKILFVFGTRPEAIKLVPIIKMLERDSTINPMVCITGQHRQMLDQVLRFFSIKPDYDFDIMTAGQSLSSIVSKTLVNLDPLIIAEHPEMVVVQGDTTSALAGALAAYYQHVKVVHIEAGLRSFNKYAPFPEEINRQLLSRLADFHFAPTKRAFKNLEKEGVKDNVWVVGNTVIDALLLGLKIIAKSQNAIKNSFSFLNKSKKIILVTCHRRENFGQPFKNICLSILKISKNPNVQIVFPVHLNPQINKPAHKILGHEESIFLIPPLDYPEFIWLLNQSNIIVTDSGGVQEEAPSLGKPVVVTREVTERPEGVAAGNAILVGSDTVKIINTVTKLLEDENVYQKMSQSRNPYGDGDSAANIVKILKNNL